MARKTKSKNGKTRTQRAPVDLTPIEVADRSEQLAGLLIEIDAKKDTLAAHSKEQRTEIKDMESRARELRTSVLEHTEEREVEVDISIDNGTVTVVRLDTGQVLESRPVTDDDRQAGLFG